MHSGKMRPREVFLLLILAALLVWVAYDQIFYAPLQQELQEISAASAEYDLKIDAAQGRIQEMHEMQAQLDLLHGNMESQIPEIPSYDNKEAVFQQLYDVLKETAEYSLNFTDPEIPEKGLVRRNISIHFRCDNFASAKAVIQALEKGRWRCQIGSISILADSGDIMNTGVQVNASVTFFEYADLP